MGIVEMGDIAERLDDGFTLGFRGDDLVHGAASGFVVVFPGFIAPEDRIVTRPGGSWQDDGRALFFERRPKLS
jgi:hypothetical protein